MPRAAGTYTAPASSWSPAVVSTSATPVDFNALLTDLSNALTQSMSRDGTSPPTANLPMAAFKITGLGSGTSSGDSLRFDQLFSQGLETDVASAATSDIGVITSTLIRITGATGITSFGTNYNGPRFIRFAGIVTLTNSATLVLPFSANLTTAANDLMIVVPLGNPATGWQVIAYQSATQIGQRNFLGIGANPTFTTVTAGTVFDGNGDVRVIQQNSQSVAYTLVLADAGKHIYHPSADVTARIWTIPANASVAYPIGTAITFVNDTGAGTISIAIASDTLVLAGAGSTGTRQFAASGVATALKVSATRWIISGTNIS